MASPLPVATAKLTLRLQGLDKDLKPRRAYGFCRGDDHLGPFRGRRGFPACRQGPL